MKKTNLKIFAVSFVTVFVMIAGLCILLRQPLVFAPGYNFPQFFTLFVLLGLLSLGLIFVMDQLEKGYQKFRSLIPASSLAIYAYFVLVSALGLFAFTLVAGFVESGLLFFYYGCVTNSCIYLFSGYTVTFVAAVYFAYRVIQNNFSKA